MTPKINADQRNSDLSPSNFENYIMRDQSSNRQDNLLKSHMSSSEIKRYDWKGVEFRPSSHFSSPIQPFKKIATKSSVALSSFSNVHSKQKAKKYKMKDVYIPMSHNKKLTKKSLFREMEQVKKYSTRIFGKN